MYNDDIRQEAELLKFLVKRAGKKIRHRKAVQYARVRFHRKNRCAPRGWPEDIIFFSHMLSKFSADYADTGMRDHILTDIDINRKMAKVKPRLKQTYDLIRVGYTQREIASICGVKEAAISIRVKKIVSILRKDG